MFFDSSIRLALELLSEYPYSNSLICKLVVVESRSSSGEQGKSFLIHPSEVIEQNPE